MHTLGYSLGALDPRPSSLTFKAEAEAKARTEKDRDDEITVNEKDGSVVRKKCEEQR